MSDVIEFTENDEVIGTWTIEWDGVATSITPTPGVADILQRAASRDVLSRVWSIYADWSNGYVTSKLVGVIELKAEPRDGDGDGMIYEGTPRERPAVVRAVDLPRPWQSRSYDAKPQLASDVQALAAMNQARAECDSDDPIEAICVDASEATERILRAQGVDAFMGEGAYRDSSHAYVVEQPTGRIFDPTLDQFYPGGRGSSTGDWAHPVWSGRDDLPTYPRNWQPSDGPAIIEPDDPFAQHYMSHRPDGTNVSGDLPFWREGEEPAWWPPTPSQRPTPERIAALARGGTETFGDGTPLPPVLPGKVRLWHYSATGNRSGIAATGLGPRTEAGESLAEADGHPAGVYLASYATALDYADSGGDLYAVDVDPAALEFDPFHRERDGSFLPDSPVYIPDGQVSPEDVHLVQPDELGVLWDQLDNGQTWTSGELHMIASAASDLHSAGHITEVEHNWIAKRIESLPRTADPVELKRLPRDGDGDGFIWDGTPRMAPLAPLRDIYDAADGAGPLLSQGAESNIWVNVAPDGNAVVVKKFNANIYTKGDPKMAADREILAHDVAEALNVNVPRMERVSDTEIIMDFVPTDDSPIPSMRNLAKVNGARDVALLDYATGNPDRHQGNVLLDGDGDIVAIDQGHAWWEAPGLGGNKPIHPQYGAPGVRPEFIEIDRASAFRGYGARPKVASHDYTLDEIERAITKVQKLAPKFDELGRSDWHRKTIERLESLKPVAIEKATP